MITEEEALARILKSIRPLPFEKARLVDAAGRFAAADTFARVALPRFDNSAMDGYAVVAAACGHGEAQRLIGEQPAGADRGLRMSPGETIRVFTGASIPTGADAVVMQEEVRVDGAEIFVQTKVEPGEFIRRRGCDVSEGQKIVGAGTRLRERTLALLASQGLGELEIGGGVRVMIVSTGDELVEPGGTLGAGQIFDSNSVLVRTLVEKTGATVTTIRHCLDDAASIEEALRHGVQFEVLILVGGVSVGAHDLVKPALNAVGAETDLWRVAVKPGKPFLFGRAGRCSIFGLPGNPVSAFITFLLFVRPAVLRLMGARDDELPLRSFPGILASEVQNHGDRPHYVRGQFHEGKFTPIGRQESHALYGLSRANALLRVPANGNLPAGATVSVIPLD